jgi:hypothetical protein
MIKKTLIFLFIFLLVYQAYIVAEKGDIFPLNKFISRIIDNPQKDKKNTEKIVNLTFSTYNKLENKTEVNCPSLKDSIVIIAFGQSNSANSASHRYSESSNNILNFYKGKCFIAKDPLLGTTGNRGNIWIPVSTKINKGQKKVVLITFGIGGTKVEDWLTSYYDFYKENVNSFKELYPYPDFAIWFQGESDRKTIPGEFQKHLDEWILTLKKDLPKTKIIITGTTYCAGQDSEIIKNIQYLTSKKFNIGFVDTDQFYSPRDRSDGCHLSSSGVEKISEIFADTINKNL